MVIYTLTFSVKFSGTGKRPWLWNAENGTRQALKPDRDGRLNVELAPLASNLIVMDDEKPKALPAGNAAAKGLKRVPVRAEGGWHLVLHPVEGKPFDMQLPELKDLSGIKGGENFAGTVDYAAEFFIDDPSAAYLDPGVVKEIAEIKINGRYAGLRWWGIDPVDIAGLLKPGKNKIEIKVTTLLFNLMRSRKDDPVAMFWVKRSRTKTCLPAGLIGPVELLYG